MRPLSHLSYYALCGLLFGLSSALLYHGWDYYATRIQDQIVCAAHSNVQLLSFLWFCESLALLACFACLWSFHGRENELQGRSLFASYTCVFLKVCPCLVKLLQLFNICQLSTICMDMLLLHECNNANTRAIFVFVIGVQWFVVLIGLAASSELFLPPYLYEPASANNSYWEQLKDFIYPLGL
ncbi:transmembrane protein, putative [Babesia ovis]|uniref:Transmembrane protein, putative n=1 Tax=Babesia ovis TaxID=5869 RepID=A0A9W5TC49_BABOV|nr:transmembrane protein, putative [Babesia ovis]